MLSIWLSKQTAVIFLKSSNNFLFLLEQKFVWCDRKTELLRSIRMSVMLSGAKKNFTDWNQFWHCTYIYTLNLFIYLFSCCTYVILDKRSKFITGDKLGKDFYLNKMLYLTFGRHTAFATVFVRGLDLIKSFNFNHNFGNLRKPWLPSNKCVELHQLPVVKLSICYFDVKTPYNLRHSTHLRKDFQ